MGSKILKIGKNHIIRLLMNMIKIYTKRDAHFVLEHFNAMLKSHVPTIKYTSINSLKYAIYRKIVSICTFVLKNNPSAL